MRVDFEDVTVTKAGRDVVRRASLTAPSGALVGVVGPNGSGKSSLLRTLYRAITPTTGAVRVDGSDVRRLTGRQAARTVAVLLQDPSTDVDLSVEETVLLGRAPHHSTFGRDTPADLAVVAEALARTGVAELADRMVATLSGGQRQRVQLARALAQQTPVLVLDEPSNHLDISHQHDLMSTVRSIGCTTIAALHDLDLAAQYCDHLVVLDAGRVVAAGPPRQVLTADLIRTVFAVDVRILDDAGDPVFAFRRLERADTHPPSTESARS